MVDVDNLSDAELRAKLIEFGFPVMPITGTTRRTMVKKLKVLLENKNKVSKDNNRRSLGRYSSEEESDSEIKTKKFNKRATMAAPPMRPPSPTLTSRISRRTPVTDSPPVKREVKTSTTTTRTTKIMQAAKDEFDTGSESDEIAEKYPDPSPNKSTSEVFRKTPSPSRLPSSFLSATSAADAAYDRVSQMRSRLSQNYDKPLYSTSTDNVLKDKDTPFLSNFTKQLSQLSEVPKSYNYKSDIIKENDVNGGGFSTRNYLNSYRAARGRPSTYDYKTSHQSIFKNNFVPITVLVVAFLFFLIIAVLYLGIRSDTSLELPATIPKCVRNDNKTKRFVNCLLEGEGKLALHLLQVLKPELDKRAVRNTCEDNKFKPYMTEQDVVHFIKTNYAVKDNDKIINDLNNLEVLTFLNPSWGLAVLQLDEDGVEFTEKTIATDMEKVNELKQSKTTALITRYPYIPWKCYLHNTFFQILNILTSIIGGVIALYLINYSYKYYNNYRQKQKEEEAAMVENIIDILQANCGGENDDNYMVINHVRDMILPITERKNKEKLWKKAVKYIEENESRIRTETQMVRGEPYEVWRWLGGPGLNASKNKSWQGQAFETQIGSVNSLRCSPAPCLKIRGMVEEGDRNTVQIKKAVLSKCAQQCRILHCAVDTNTNCVYLKCADPSDAAIAYRNLHGWWYAGNLVTVKYLRLERYMERFPDSPVSGPPYLK